MLSLLFGGALRLGGGFAVLGLALIALIALLSGRIGGSGLSGLPRLGRYGGIELLYQSPKPGRGVHRVRDGGRVGHCTSRRGRRDGLGRIGALQTRWAAGGDEQRLHLDQRVVRCQTEPLNRRAGHVADCVLGLQRQGTA